MSTAASHRRCRAVWTTLSRVSQRMVLPIPMERRVGHHDRRVSFLPEGPLIRPTDSRDNSRCGNALRRKAGVLAKAGNDSAHKIAGCQIADESDEVARLGIEEAEWKGIRLAAISV